MTIAIIVVHVVLSLLLVLSILLHRGQGGGLSDMLGGGGGSGLQGSAIVEKNLDRITVVVALLFTLTNSALVVLL